LPHLQEDVCAEVPRGTGSDAVAHAAEGVPVQALARRRRRVALGVAVAVAVQRRHDGPQVAIAEQFCGPPLQQPCARKGAHLAMQAVVVQQLRRQRRGRCARPR
jgi:hypothetical protein